MKIKTILKGSWVIVGNFQSYGIYVVFELLKKLRSTVNFARTTKTKISVYVFPINSYSMDFFENKVKLEISICIRVLVLAVNKNIWHKHNEKYDF